jgi:hypothetical protein
LIARKVTDAIRLVDIESTTRETESEARVSLSSISMNRVACLQSPHVGDMCEMAKRRQTGSVVALMFEGKVA